MAKSPKVFLKLVLCAMGGGNIIVGVALLFMMLSTPTIITSGVPIPHCPVFYVGMVAQRVPSPSSLQELELWQQ